MSADVRRTRSWESATRALGFLAVVFAISIAVPAVAEVTLPLSTPFVDLDFVDVELQVVIEAGITPAITVLSPLHGATIGQLFSLTQVGPRTEVRSLIPPPAVTPLQLRASLYPGQRLHLAGTRIKATVRAEREEADPENSPSPEQGGAQLTIDVQSSSVSLQRLTGTASIKIVSRASTIRIDACSGAVVVEAVGGGISILAHCGRAEMTVEDTEVEVSEHQGYLAIHANGEETTVEGGAGHLQLDIAAASVQASGWRGPISLTGEQTSAHLSDLGDGPFEVDLNQSTVSFSYCSGLVQASLRGGSLSSDGCTGRIEVNGDEGARVDIRDQRGPVTVTLRTESEAELFQIQSAVNATVDSATLSITGAADLKLEATNSRIDLRDVGNPKRLELDTCTGSLDFTAVAGMLELSIRGDSFFDVILSPPCEVAVGGTGEVDPVGVTVFQCTRMSAIGKGVSKVTEQAPGAPPLTRLSLAVDASSQVHVSGY